MIKPEKIEIAKKLLYRDWNNADIIIEESFKYSINEISFGAFLKNCIACGGDWGQMVLTGIHKLYPTVWNLIPNDMGVNSFADLLAVLTLCGVIID